MTKLIPGEAPIVDNIYEKEYKDFSLDVGFEGSGYYEFSCYPNDLWISIYSITGKKIGWGTGYLKIKLGPGNYIIRVRHNLGDGIYRITCGKIGK
jgi:hypothetical protein